VELRVSSTSPVVNAPDAIAGATDATRSSPTPAIVPRYPSRTNEIAVPPGTGRLCWVLSGNTPDRLARAPPPTDHLAVNSPQTAYAWHNETALAYQAVGSTGPDLLFIPGSAGSVLEFEDRGAHDLKGVPGERRLYALA
jgi:hypothetical protein